MNQSLILDNRRFNLPKKILKYYGIFRVNYLSNVAYLTDLFSIAGMVMFRVWLFAQLYRLVFAQSGQSLIGGLDLPQTIWTLTFAQSFIMSHRSRVLIRDITEDIQSGNIAYALGRPYNFILYYCFYSFGHIGAVLFSTVLLSSMACLVLVGPIPFTVQSLMAGALLFFVGSVIDILISILLAMAAFWTEETRALQRIYQKTQLVFGGVILPLSLFPENLRKIAEVLPFGLPFHAPARMLVKFEAGLFVKLLLVQAVWLVIFIALNILVFKKGVKNVSINGG